MKGIILAGGSGTRLYPITKSVSKQLLPVYDKPMIYYPISVLMLAGIKDILIITTPHDIKNFKILLGSGNRFGVNFTFAVQDAPNGLAEAFIIGKEFIGREEVCLILGDNIFYGSGLKKLLKDSINIVKKDKKAVIFGTYVSDPKRFGIVEFSDNNDVISIEEKPKNPKSNYAIPGLYFYPNDVVSYVNQIVPSERGELEISSLNAVYVNNKSLKLKLLGRGFSWIDTGTHEALNEASNFVKSVEKLSGRKIACLEEIALINGFISKKQALDFASRFANSGYGNYIKNCIKNYNL